MRKQINPTIKTHLLRSALIVLALVYRVGMRGLVRIRVIGAAGAILFVQSVVADDWPYYQHDAWHSGDSSAFVNPQALSLAWTAPSSPTGYSTPVIVGNSIYAMKPGGYRWIADDG